MISLLNIGVWPILGSLIKDKCFGNTKVALFLHIIRWLGGISCRFRHSTFLLILFARISLGIILFFFAVHKLPGTLEDF